MGTFPYWSVINISSFDIYIKLIQNRISPEKISYLALKILTSTNKLPNFVSQKKSNFLETISFDISIQSRRYCLSIIDIYRTSISTCRALGITRGITCISYANQLLGSGSRITTENEYRAAVCCCPGWGEKKNVTYRCRTIQKKAYTAQHFQLIIIKMHGPAAFQCNLRSSNADGNK